MKLDHIWVMGKSFPDLYLPFSLFFLLHSLVVILSYAQN